jgi:hypothetical protein
MAAPAAARAGAVFWDDRFPAIDGGRPFAPPAACWLLPFVVVNRLLVEVQLIGRMVELLFSLVEGVEISERLTRRSETNRA